MRKIAYLLGMGVLLGGTGCFFEEHHHDRDNYRGGAYDGTYRTYGRGAYDDDYYRSRHDPWEHHDYRY